MHDSHDIYVFVKLFDSGRYVRLWVWTSNMTFSILLCFDTIKQLHRNTHPLWPCILVVQVRAYWSSSWLSRFIFNINLLEQNLRHTHHFQPHSYFVNILTYIINHHGSATSWTLPYGSPLLIIQTFGNSICMLFRSSQPLYRQNIKLLKKDI